MMASALEIWVLRSEYKLINFIVRGSFRCISSQFRRPKYEKFPGGACPRTPKRFDQHLVFVPLFWLLQYLVLANSWLFGNPKHRHRLKTLFKNRKSGSKMVQTIFVSFNIKRFARYEFFIVFVNFRNLIELFSVFHTFASKFSCRRFRHLYRENVY